MNITVQQASDQRNIMLYRYARDFNRLPPMFPAVTTDEFGVVALHRWMIRTYLQIPANFEPVQDNEIDSSDTQVLDEFKNFQTPDFEELLVITLSVYFSDSGAPVRAVYRLRQHVDAMTYFTNCGICKSLQLKTSFR